MFFKNWYRNFFNFIIISSDILFWSFWFNENKEKAIKDYINVTNYLEKEFPKIELNAGHDLNLENLRFFLDKINNVKEVSIGHALICDTFEFGLQETIKKYLTLTDN